MRVTAFVPFKCFTRAKGRLRRRYSDPQVEALGRAMLADVLEALAGTRGLERVAVLTDDIAVAAVAQEAGAAVRLRDPDPGLNPAIEEATTEAAAEGFEASLIVLGDLPLLASKDIEAVIESGQQHAVVIVPSSDGGTALLFRRPPACIPACFGTESARAHEKEARARKLRLMRMTLARNAATLDIDTPEDAQQLLESKIPCRTGELLRKFSD